MDIESKFGSESGSPAAAATLAANTRLAAPVFTLLCPPRIDDISHEALVLWKNLRAEYESKVEMWCTGTSEDLDQVMVFVKNAMDIGLLDT